MVTIAVEGCCHGELDAIYATIMDMRHRRGINVDLLLVCGDFQSLRYAQDLDSLNVPQKYKQLGEFTDYFSGAKVAPIPTVFIGGNHEASNVLQSLYYGGYVAHNIYFMGFAGMIKFGDIRIAGISGIYDKRDYKRPHFERPPYDQSSLRSVYHVRELEEFKLSHISSPVDIFLSHDWPRGVWEHGDTQALLRVKPYFADDIASNELGSPGLMSLLKTIRPKFHFAAHLHVKFAAVVPHPSTPERSSTENEPENPIPAYTRFLALDKVIPGRGFLQVIELPNSQTSPTLEWDPAWLAILQHTHRYMATRSPIPRVSAYCTVEQIQAVKSALETAGVGSHGRYPIPTLEQSLQFMQGNGLSVLQTRATPSCCGDVQSDMLLHILGIEHTWVEPVTRSTTADRRSDPNEIDIDDFVEEKQSPNPSCIVKKHTDADPNEIDLSDVEDLELPVPDPNEVDVDDV